MERLTSPGGGVLGLLNRPWAIQPEILLEICEIYRAHVAGRPIDIAAIEKRLGKPLDNRPKPYRVEEGGVAVLLIEGVLSKRMNMFSEISGGTSTQLMARDFRAALEDDDVKSILLVIDSPGGEVDGTQEFARLVAEARSVKPVVALAEDTMASAAYWIGSAAQSVYLSSETTQVGSIGVIATHVDRSAADKEAGLKYTEVTAGRYKGLGSPHQPLSKEDRGEIQDEVDYIYSVFVNDISANRGVTPAKVLSDMADGRIFIGQEAIDAGLVDGLVSRVDLLEAMSRMGADGITVSARRAAKKAVEAPPADPEKVPVDPRANLVSERSDTEQQKEKAMDEATIAATKKLEDDNKALLAASEAARTRLAAFAERDVERFIEKEAVEVISLKDLKSGNARALLLSLAMRDAAGESKSVKMTAPDGTTTEVSEYEGLKSLIRGLPPKLSAEDRREVAVGGDEGSDGDLPANVERYNFAGHKNSGPKFANTEFHDQVLAHMAAEEKAGRKVSYRQAYEAVSRNNSRKSG
ncbi:MAG: S49 family peptidase [Acidobacteriota bacterium]|nr:S49 family peptidase [Acidobacteriota bacterium]